MSRHGPLSDIHASRGEQGGTRIRSPFDAVPTREPCPSSRAHLRVRHRGRQRGCPRARGARLRGSSPTPNGVRTLGPGFRTSNGVATPGCREVQLTWRSIGCGDGCAGRRGRQTEYSRTSTCGGRFDRSAARSSLSDRTGVAGPRAGGAPGGDERFNSLGGSIGWDPRRAATLRPCFSKSSGHRKGRPHICGPSGRGGGVGQPPLFTHRVRFRNRVRVWII